VARERFQVAIAGGLGPLSGRAFRIGHLGDCNPAMILGALGGVEAALLCLGVPIGEGGVSRAVRCLAGLASQPVAAAATAAAAAAAAPTAAT
jgi:alanine-glyoxylate transaminase/serine-glyoxylate transaminase/serine-pyruvate transaminase